MMMYCPIKSGCQKISSFVDMVETVIFGYMSPHCDLDLDECKPIFFEDTHHTMFGSKRFNISERE